MSRKKQAQKPDRTMAKIDHRIHKSLKEYAEKNGKYLGFVIDELLVAGAEAKGIPLEQVHAVSAN